MKKLLEELRELDIEEQYEVPKDFNEKVIKEINKREHSFALGYVISALTVVAAMVIVVFKVSTQSMRSVELCAIDSVRSNIQVAESTTAGISDEKYFDMIPALGTLNFNASLDNYDEAKSQREFDKEKVENNFENIITLLNKNDIETEILENGIRVKCSKQKAEEILKNYISNISIETDGDFVVIK